MVVPWICVSISKSQVICRKAKKPVFGIFWWYSAKKFQKILIRPILTFDALPIAHFEAYVPNFLKHLWKLAISLKLWVPAHSEVGWSRTVAAKIGVFRPLFWREKNYFTNLTPRTPPSVIHGWKATDLLFMMVKRKNYFFFTLWSVRFSWTHQYRLSDISRDCVLDGWSMFLQDFMAYFGLFWAVFRV